MGNVLSKLFGGQPKAPARVSQPGQPITQMETQGAKDETLRRMAQLRAANVRTSQLSTPNVKRKVMGAGV